MRGGIVVHWAAALGISLAVGANAAHADSLIGVVQESLETNPELGAIRFNRRAIDNELNAARGLNLPTFDVRGEVGRHREHSITGLGVVNSNDWHEREGVGTVFSQRIFDGFESRHEIARQRNRVESARWRVNDTANSIALRAVQAYLECIRAGAVLKAAKSNVAAHQSLLDRVRRRVDGGVANAAESAEAGARTANARAILAQAEEAVLNAAALFKATVGRMPANLSPAPPARDLPESEEMAVAEAVEAAPSVIATQFDAIAADAAVGSAYSRFSPKLNFEVNTHHGWGQVEDNDRNYEASAMLVVRWNLFNGGIDKARVWEARARSMEAQGINANTALIVERETRTSWASLRAASVRVPELRLQFDLQRQRKAAYLEQFDTGQRRLLDLLDAQNEIFVVESSLRTEELIGLYSGYRLLASVGRLVPAIGLEMPAEAAVPPAPTLIDGWRTEIEAWPRDNYHDRAGYAEPAK
jgi:adhesin transport system outer membrane protein